MVRCDARNRPSQAPPQRRRLRIAVVGLGIAGATTAHFLSKEHDVIGIESAPAAGLHVHSVDNEQYRFDMPLRAISPHYYPNLFALYKYLGVTLFGVNYQNTGVDADSGEAYFQYTNILIGGYALSFPALRSASLWISLCIVWDYLWFVFATSWELWRTQSKTETKKGVALSIRTMTLHEYLRHKRYSTAFEHRFLLPVLSTLLSCSYQQAAEYPADYIADFFCSRRTTFFTGWNRVQEGVQEVSARLLTGVPCRYGRRVQSVRRIVDPATGVAQVELVMEGTAPSSSDGGSSSSSDHKEYFDHVIIATESNAVAHIVKDLCSEELKMVTAVSSYTADIVAHVDASLMPRQTDVWSGLNYFSREGDLIDAINQKKDTSGLTNTPQRDGSHEKSSGLKQRTSPSPRHDASMTSAHLNQFSTRKMNQPVFETWNPYTQPAADKVIKQVTMSRAVWTVEGRDLFFETAPKFQGRGGIWYAGSYASPGVTLLEQAVHSALDVCADIGVALPMSIQPTAKYYTVAVVFALFLQTIHRFIAPFVFVARFLLGRRRDEKP